MKGFGLELKYCDEATGKTLTMWCVACYAGETFVINPFVLSRAYCRNVVLISSLFGIVLVVRLR